MSELFENLELQMREEAEAKNPRSAILASQMESEKRFASFISSNVGRITVIENELKEIAYKYASQYDVDPQMVFEAVAESLIKNAADENDEDQTEEILKFWESVSPEMAEKYRKKITPPKMKNKEGEIVDATDEALTQRSENFAKKKMEHDPNTVIEGVDAEMKERGHGKCRNCGSHAGVKNYGEAGDFCSVKCGREFIDKHESSFKTAEWEPNIQEENIEQLDLLGEILDAENAGDFDTVASLSRQYKQQYGRITPAMMEKARNRDFAVRELDEDFGPGVRGNDLGDNFDDREASVKRSETEPPWYLDTEQEIGDWQAHQDGLADARSDYESWWNALTPEEQKLVQEKDRAWREIEYNYGDSGPLLDAIFKEYYALEGLKETDPQEFKKQVDVLIERIKQNAADKKKAIENFQNTYGERNNPKMTEIYNKRGSFKQAETQRQQERKAAFQEIMKAKKSGVPHDDILEMLKDYKADFGRNFSTDSQKQANLDDDMERDDDYDVAREMRNEYEVSPNNYPHWISTLKYFDKEGNPDYLNVVNAIAKGYNLTPQEVIDIYNDYRNQPFRESSIKEAALAAFIEANQDVLFPEWMIREAGGKSWKGMGVKDVLDLSNLYGTKFYDKLGPQEEEEDATDPEAAVNAQQGVQGLVPGGEVAADEQPTVEQPAVKKNLLQQKYEDAQEKINPSEEEWAAMQRSFADERARQKAIQDAKNEKEQSLREYWENVAQGGPSQMGGRGKYRDEYLRGANVKTASLEQQLVNFYINVGVEPKTASIFVQSVGEMAQLQQSNPGLPIAAPDPETMDINKEIGGKEGDKYQNWHVDEKQRGLGIEHQNFTDFGEPVREFIQPGGEAPYSENTKEKIDKGAEESDMNAKNVKQDDNAPKQSKVANKQIIDLEKKLYEMMQLAEDAGEEMAHYNVTYFDDEGNFLPPPPPEDIATYFGSLEEWEKGREEDMQLMYQWERYYNRMKQAIELLEKRIETLKEEDPTLNSPQREQADETNQRVDLEEEPYEDDKYYKSIHGKKRV
jgi:hypothetical protein